MKIGGRRIGAVEGVLAFALVCIIALGYYSTLYAAEDGSSSDGGGARWSAKEWYGGAGDGVEDGGDGDEVEVREIHLEPPGFWAAADVRSAKSLSPEEFKRDYMLAGKPVIIRDDPGALALAAKLNVDVLLSHCGDLSPDLGNRIAEVIKSGIPPELQAGRGRIHHNHIEAISGRLQETDGITLQKVVEEMEGDGPTKTLRDFFEGEHFRSVKTVQDPRFPDAVKDWTHPADYLWPPSIHSWRVGQCQPLDEIIKGELDDTRGGHGGGASNSHTTIKPLP